MIDGQSERLDTWAVVEAMGFKKLAGRVTEQSVAGSALIRVDVPETRDANGEHPTPAYSKLIGVGSIYMITPCDETTARKAARAIEVNNSSPLPVYIPPEQPRLAAPDYEIVDSDETCGADSADGDVLGKAVYFCTLPRGHVGDHLTLDAANSELTRWPRTDTESMPL